GRVRARGRPRRPASPVQGRHARGLARRGRARLPRRGLGAGGDRAGRGDLPLRRRARHRRGGRLSADPVRSGGERERRRRRLAALLLDPAGQDAEAVARAAELARWPIPLQLAVLALAGEDAGPIARRLHLDALVGADAGGAGRVLPAPDGPGGRAGLARALSGEPIGLDPAGEVAALGPTVSPRDAHRSLRWARLTLALFQQGALPRADPLRAEDHLAQLILLRDGELARALVSGRLAALAPLPAPERERLLATLAAWLAHQRHTPTIA